MQRLILLLMRLSRKAFANGATEHATVTCSVIYPPLAMLHFGVSPMSIHLRSVLLASLLLTSLPAAAQDVSLPREPQIGPRPFYLVDKMKDGALKRQLAQCT